MPRWPAGLHPYAGSGPAYGYRPVRPPATPQRHYWRHSATALHAASNAVFPLPPAGGPGPLVTVGAAAGPTAAGEVWTVTHVQVQTGTGYGQPPLIVQQINAQVLGQLTSAPPPVPVQVWLAVSGVNLHLLAQSTQGGYDGIDVGGQTVRPGETIQVIWYLPSPAPPSAWFVLRGTRHTLSVI